LINERSPSGGELVSVVVVDQGDDDSRGASRASDRRGRSEMHHTIGAGKAEAGLSGVTNDGESQKESIEAHHRALAITFLSTAN
jgi:hypothetical protein